MSEQMTSEFCFLILMSLRNTEATLMPNPSLHLTFASRLRRLSPAGELKR